MNTLIRFFLFSAFLIVHSMVGQAAPPERSLPPPGSVSRDVRPATVPGSSTYRRPVPVSQSFDPERAGARRYQTYSSSPDPGSNGSSQIDSDCEGAYFAKLTLAAAAGSCSAIESAPNSPGGKSACGNQMPSSGAPSDKAKYDQSSHAPDVSGSEVGAKNGATDCSGVPCQAWIAQGFRPEGKDMGGDCPNSDRWAQIAEKGSQCLQPVENESEYKVGDLRCGPGEGGKQGHCVFVCDQKASGGSSASGGVKPTSNINDLSICEAVSTAVGWTMRPGTALLNTKLQGPRAKTLRPALKSEKPECYGEPKEVKNDDGVKQCKTLPKIAQND